MQSTPPQDPAQLALSAPPGSALAALVATVGAASAAIVMWLTPPHEGTVLFGYRDIGGVVTACTGHTATAVLGRRYTRKDCDELLASDLVKHARDLACIPNAAQLQPHVRAAFLSLAFNVGPGKAGVKDGICVLKDGRSSSIRRHASAGNVAAACASITDWTGVKGRDCALAQNRCGGIPARRADERAVCEGRYPGGPADPASATSAASGAGT